MPATAPMSESNPASTSTCRISREDVAPNADRIENSCRRAIARLKIKLARLAQAIKSTMPTAPRITSNARLTCIPTMAWFRVITDISVSALCAGDSSATRLPIAATNDRAWSEPTPGASRAILSQAKLSTGSAAALLLMAGSQISVLIGKSAFRPATPITTQSRPRKCKRRPRTEGSDPKRLRHRCSLMTITRSAPLT